MMRGIVLLVMGSGIAAAAMALPPQHHRTHRHRSPRYVEAHTLKNGVHSRTVAAQVAPAPPAMAGAPPPPPAPKPMNGVHSLGTGAAQPPR